MWILLHKTTQPTEFHDWLTAKEVCRQVDRDARAVSIRDARAVIIRGEGGREGVGGLGLRARRKEVEQSVVTGSGSVIREWLAV